MAGRGHCDRRFPDGQLPLPLRSALIHKHSGFNRETSPTRFHSFSSSKRAQALSLFESRTANIRRTNTISSGSIPPNQDPTLDDPHFALDTIIFILRPQRFSPGLVPFLSLALFVVTSSKTRRNPSCNSGLQCADYHLWPPSKLSRSSRLHHEESIYLAIQQCLQVNRLPEPVIVPGDARSGQNIYT
jgi:hypothetical protein